MTRVLTALVFLPILFSALWLGSPIWFAAIAALGILLGLYEYYQLAKQEAPVPGMIGGAAILTAFYFQQHSLIAGILAALATLEMLIQLFRRAGDEDFSEMLQSAAISVFGVLYVVLLGGYIVAIRVIDSPIPKLAPKLLTLFFIVIFAGDTGAYYTGRTMGRKKLAPKV